MYRLFNSTDKRIGKTLMSFAVFTTIMPTIKIMKFPISDIFIIVCLLYYVVNNKMKIHFRYTDYFYALGVFMLLFSYSISTFFSEYTNTIDYIKIIVQYFFSLSIVKIMIESFDEKSIDNLIITFINGVVVSSFVILVIVGLFSDFSYKLFKLGILASHRRFGAFVGPNMLAKIMASMVPLLFLTYINKKITIKKFIFSLAVMVISLFKTASNGGLISFIVAISLIVLLMTNKNNRKNIYIVMSIFIVITILVFKLEFINTDLITTRVINVMADEGIEELGSYQVKKQLMIEGWHQIKNSPIIGMGPFSFREISSTSNTIHNSYILTWVEGGIFAFFGLLFIILSVFVSIHKIEDTSTKRAYQIFLVVFIINLFTGTDYYQRYRIIPLLLVYVSSKYKSK